MKFIQYEFINEKTTPSVDHVHNEITLTVECDMVLSWPHSPTPGLAVYWRDKSGNIPKEPNQILTFHEDQHYEITPYINKNIYGVIESVKMRVTVYDRSAGYTG